MSNYLTTDTELKSVADKIRSKSGGTNDLVFPSGFVNEIGNIVTGGGDIYYTSSTGLLYTPIMTIDLSMERTNGYDIHATLVRYGDMPYLEDLTLTGIVRNSAAISMAVTTGDFSTTHFPRLKKLKIQPTEIRNGNGTAYTESDTAYNKLKFGHYAFTGTDLTELVLGKVGGPYFVGSGYFRNDLPTPPGTNAYQVGSTSGLSLKIYVASHLDKAGFATGPAPNTTVTQYDYTNGEVLNS